MFWGVTDMSVVYQSDKDYKQHSTAIHLIAEQYHINEAMVREYYEAILEKLQVKARCKQFLSVLVTRHVKEILQKQAHTH